MSMFSDLRAQLVVDLAPLSVDVSPSWPDVIAPPCAFITPPIADDYAIPGPNFGEFTIALDLVIIVGHDDPTAALEALEELVEVALVNTANWTVVAVDAPAPTKVSESGAEYLASIIHLSFPVRP